MANRYKNLIYSNAEYTHSYGGFKGVQLNAGSLIKSTSRLAYSKNMYKDYDGDGADVIESIPGYRCFAQYQEPVHALYYQRSASGGEDHVIVHTGNTLMRHPVSDIHKKWTVGEEIATVKSAKSFGFEYGRYFYVMDTESIIRIDESGVAQRIGDAGAHPYVPTTFVSGEEYEQRNLLTDRFMEEYYVADPCAYLYSTEGLKFNITDPYLGYCSVSGAEDGISGEVYFPAYVNIAGVSYKVTAIDDYALADCTGISAVYIPHGVTKIGRRAFSGCTSLKTVVTPPTIERIETRAFYDCDSLTTVYLGAGLVALEGEAFAYCHQIKSVCYARGEDDLEKVDGHGYLGSYPISYHTRYERIRVSLPFHDKVKSVSSVKVNNENVSFTSTVDTDGVRATVIDFDSLSDATGIEVTVSGVLMPLESDWQSDMTVLATSTPDKAIINCTTAEVFDGRIFFSGNPSFPNTVFYTERTKAGQDGEIYVGRYNYFNDGVGSYRVKAMLAVRDMLAVFKEGDDGSGGIFYHKKETTGLGAVNTVYPVAYVHSGICAVGGCLSFLDDPVFLTDEGLMALNSENINYQRNVVCRSHNVNYTLLKEDLSKAHLTEWLGYLVLGVNGKILLADSRAVFRHAAGSYEYEWFLLEDIGAYSNDHVVYRYAADPIADAQVHPTRVGKSVESLTVMSAIVGTSISHYYVVENGIKYRVLPSEERIGGSFHPATVFISHARHLFFATEGGHICVFNNDMRGVAPDSVKKSDDYNEAEYLAAMGNRIHPEFYSFVGHAPEYLIKTALDDCGVPHLTKSTVKKSLVVKARSYSPDAIDCEVTTDAQDPVYVGSFPSASVGFDDFDFTDTPWYVSRYTSMALPENEKRWIEKQLTLRSSTYACPIALYSISYRYVIKGRIKNNV